MTKNKINKQIKKKVMENHKMDIMYHQVASKFSEKWHWMDRTETFFHRGCN